MSASFYVNTLVCAQLHFVATFCTTRFFCFLAPVNAGTAPEALLALVLGVEMGAERGGKEGALAAG